MLGGEYLLAFDANGDKKVDVMDIFPKWRSSEAIEAKKKLVELEALVGTWTDTTTALKKQLDDAAEQRDSANRGYQNKKAAYDKLVG